QGYFQVSMDGSLEEFCETWPEQGMMHNGECFAPVISAIPTSENGCFFLGTPCAGDGNSNYAMSRERALKRLAGPWRQQWWIAYGILLHNLNKGYANPRFAEALMGFPDQWTALEE